MEQKQPTQQRSRGGAGGQPPILYFVLRSEREAQLFALHGGRIDRDPRFRIEKPSAVEFSEDGRVCAVAHEKGIAVVDCDGDWAVQHALPEEDVVALSFSPRGSFLLTLARLPSPRVGQPAPVPDKGNLCVWDLRSGALLAHFLHKKTGLDAWPLIRWSEDEELAAKMVSNEIQFFSNSNFKQITKRVKQEGLANFALAPGSLPPLVAAFAPEKKGGPGQVRIFKYPAVDQSVVAKTLWNAQTAELKWAPGATGLLVGAKTDVDKSGKSYYGSTALHFLSPNTVTEAALSLDEEGPVHEYRWSPDGSKFVVVYGYMPARATLFDAKCNKIADFGKAARNTARWSPCSRLLALGGFGNLNGQIDIWDVNKVRKVGSCQANCASSLEWSPDSANLLAAVLSPKIRVDNGVTVFRYDGTTVGRAPFDQLYQAPRQAIWRAGRLEDFPVIRIRAAKTTTATGSSGNSSTSTGRPNSTSGGAKPAIYQPPSRRGMASGPVTALRDEEEAAPKKYTPPSGKEAKKPVELPVGFEPESKTAKRNKQRRQRKKQQGAVGEHDQAQEEHQGEETDTPEEKAKKAKALEKKLRQIAALKEKQSAGASLDPEQLLKIAAEADLCQQLRKLRP